MSLGVDVFFFQNWNVLTHSLDVQGLAMDANGAEAGKMVVINALIPVE